MKWVFIILGSIIAIPILFTFVLPGIWYVIKLLIGLLGLGFGIFGVVMLLTKNIQAGLFFLALAAVAGMIAPKLDEWDFDP